MRSKARGSTTGAGRKGDQLQPNTTQSDSANRSPASSIFSWVLPEPFYSGCVTIPVERQREHFAISIS